MNYSDITILYTFRDRETSRLKHSVQSLLDHGVQAHFLVVDYGSKPSLRLELKALSQQLPLTVVSAQTQGLPWSRARAINLGVRHCATPWVVTTDVDILYRCNPFDYCGPLMVPGKVFIMQTWWLHAQGDLRRAWFGGKAHPGVFVLQEREAFDRLGGYSEGIFYWGDEDWDWVDRLVHVGYEVSWVPQTYRIEHVWHPVGSDGAIKPVTASYDTVCCRLRRQLDPVSRVPWGRDVTQEDRPILNFLEQKDHEFVVEFAAGKLASETHRLVAALTQNQLVRCELGPRRVKRKLDWVQSWVRKLFERIVDAAGLILCDQINTNFDTLYAIIPVLKDDILIDWYASDHQETVWLLARKEKQLQIDR